MKHSSSTKKVEYNTEKKNSKPAPSIEQIEKEIPNTSEKKERRDKTVGDDFLSKFNKIWNQEDIESKGSLPKSQVALLMKKLFDEHKDGDDILEVLFDKLDED